MARAFACGRRAISASRKPKPAGRGGRAPRPGGSLPAGRDGRAREARPSSSGRRAASRNTDRTTASTLAHPFPALSKEPSSATLQLGRRPVDHGFEQGFFGREPVEDRLLANPEPVCQGVQRGRLVTAGAERGQGGIEDPIRGASPVPTYRMVDESAYRMVDRFRARWSRPSRSRDTGPGVGCRRPRRALIFVTGATGFLGTALVERLLRSVPGCRVAVLIRPTRRSSAAERQSARSCGTTASTGCAASSATRFDEMVASSDCRRSRATSRPRASDSTKKGRAVLARRTSSSTRPRRSPSTHPSTPLSR